MRQEACRVQQAGTR